MIHYPSRWTTGVKRASFVWYPWELSYLSSLLKRRTKHDIKMVDGCLLGLDWEKYARLIAGEKPDYLVIESSSRTLNEDLKLCRAVKKASGARIIITGQHASAYPAELCDKADFVCIGEYEFTVLDIVNGVDRSDIKGLYPNPGREPCDVNELPWPEDEDIKRIDYCIPGPPGLRYRQIQAYASRGCPFRCSFCVCSNLYYNKPTWRPRDRDDVVNEIKYLKEKYKGRMEGVFFDEEVHNFSREKTIELCDKIAAAGLNDLKYTAMCMYRTLDDEVLAKMKKAGYYQLRIGIETASEKVAQSIGMTGKVDIEKLVRVLESAKKSGIDIFGTFLIGGPGATKEEDQKTIDLMKDLLKKELICELQISICTPQPGTPFFILAEKKGWLLTKDWQRFDGTSESVVNYPQYSKDEIEEMFHAAEDIGHYYRGRIALRREGLIPTLIKALKKRGFWGSIGLVVRQFFNSKKPK
jgi:radical SAM superfamily enzyme YgiQ (UPF0313 family)